MFIILSDLITIARIAILDYDILLKINKLNKGKYEDLYYKLVDIIHTI